MSNPERDQNRSLQPNEARETVVRYPENHVLSIVDTRDQLESVLSSLSSSGFIESEVSTTSGRAAADAIKENTGRTGLTHLVIRVASAIGLQNEESETKDRYEQALRDGGYVVAVQTLTDERKELAAQLLASHGGHFINFLGRFSIERLSR